MKEKQKRMWKPLALTLILSVAIWGASLTKPVQALEPPIMTTFRAATITGGVGDLRTVTVMAYDIDKFWGWNIFMTWDPLVLDFVSLTFADFLAGLDPSPAKSSQLGYTDDGWLMCTELRFGGQSGVTADSGLLVSVVFEILTTTDSVVSIDSQYTYWLDEDYGPAQPWGDTEGEMIKENGGLVSPWDEDINIDGIVDCLDLAYVAINWGKTGGAIQPARADVDGDGDIDIVDLSMVAIKYGEYTGY
jgi:hypothetical protein